MQSDATQPLVIGPLPPEEYAQALRLVFGRMTEADRQRQIDSLLGAADGGKAALEGLCGGHRGNRLVGAALVQIQPGRTATVWPPKIVAGEPLATAESLLGEVSRFLEGRDVRLAQTLLESDSPREESLLCKGGFNRLSELLYLVSPNSEFPTAPSVTSLEFETYSPANHQRLARIVEATYQQTLDCPQLDGIRDVEDVLAGYRASGVFDASRWLIVRHDGADVGCLLLGDFPENDNLELVYMGVTPSREGMAGGLNWSVMPNGGPVRQAGQDWCWRWMRPTGRQFASMRPPDFRPGSGGRSLRKSFPSCRSYCRK